MGLNIQEQIPIHMNIVKQLDVGQIEQFGRLCTEALKTGHTIFFMGNGGSAADSQHLAAELVGRFETERRGLPAVAFTTDTSILSAVGNDYGFENIFVRQVEALVKEGDVVVGISTSGNSRNVVAAIQAAREKHAVTIGMTGAGGGALAGLCRLCIRVPSMVAARIQEAHILIGHLVCEIIDREFEHHVS